MDYDETRRDENKGGMLPAKDRFYTWKPTS